MRRMGIEALYRRPRTTRPEPGHKIYPYLLRGKEITRPNQVWAMDITYIPMKRGFVYLAVVSDWFSRRVLSWRVSITMEAAFCVETLHDALAKYGKSEISNTGQWIAGSPERRSDRDRYTPLRQHDGNWTWRATCSSSGCGVPSSTRGVPESLRQRQRGAHINRPLSRLLQLPPSAFEP